MRALVAPLLQVGFSSCPGGDGSLPKMPILWRGVLGCFFSSAGSLKHHSIGAWTAGLSLGSVSAAEDPTWRGVSDDSR